MVATNSCILGFRFYALAIRLGPTIRRVTFGTTHFSGVNSCWLSIRFFYGRLEGISDAFSPEYGRPHIMHIRLSVASAALTKRPISLSRLIASFTRHLSSTFTMSSTLFKGNIDRFQGVTVSSLAEPCDDLLFPDILKASIERWKENGMRGVWFKVALEHAGWVPHLAQNGFRYHNAQPSYVTMVRWLPDNEVCNIPTFAHTLVGVGAIVMNEMRQILVVNEKYYQVPHWKLPGGYVEPGEDIPTAAEREVMEETSVRARFKFLVCFRHMHKAMFGCSDLYYIVALTPDPGQQILKKCDREIAAVKWIDVNDYLNHTHIHSTNRFFVQKYLECEANNIGLSFHTDHHPLLKKPYKIYSLDFGY